MVPKFEQKCFLDRFARNQYIGLYEIIFKKTFCNCNNIHTSIEVFELCQYYSS